jgi:HK97 family phage major capsid protein
LNRHHARYKEVYIPKDNRIMATAPQRLSSYTHDQKLQRLAREFSVARLVGQLSEEDGLRDGPEYELCTEAARGELGGLDRRRPIIPWSVFQQRDATVAGTGGYLVGVDSAEAVDALRPWSVAARAGITIMSGLRNNMTLPATDTTTTGYWLNTEGTTVTESTPAIGQVALSPKTAGAMLEFSRLLQLQSPGIETVLRRDLLRTVGSLVDAAIFNGSGSGGEPLGLLGTSGVGATAGASLDWADVLGMQESIAAANADDANVAFIATPAVRKLLSGRERATGSGFIWGDGRIAGAPGYVSTDVPTATMIAGDWSNVVLGLWGPGFEFAVDPTAGFKAGIIAARVLVSCDVGVRVPAAMNAATSIS